MSFAMELTTEDYGQVEQTLRSFIETRHPDVLLWQRTRPETTRQFERIMHKLSFDRDLLVVKVIDNFGQSQTAIYFSAKAYDRERFHPRQYPIVSKVLGEDREFARWKTAART